MGFRRFSDWKETIKSEKKGLFCWNKNVEGLVLFLRPLKNDWEYWETLIRNSAYCPTSSQVQRNE